MHSGAPATTVSGVLSRRDFIEFNPLKTPGTSSAYSSSLLQTTTMSGLDSATAFNPSSILVKPGLSIISNPATAKKLPEKFARATLIVRLPMGKRNTLGRKDAD